MNGASLGATIRSYRQRKHQIHNGKPWTLDDLAVATNDDKAHLSRIERGTILPNRATLLRIAQALDLSRPETEFLLRLAGFGPLFDAPDAKAAAAAVRWLAQQSRSHLNPLTLYAADLRVWYSNALWLRLMDMTPQRFRICMQGKHQARNHVDPCSTSALVERRYRNYAEIRQRAVTRLRAAWIDGLVQQDVVDELLKDEAFRALWDACEARLPHSTLIGDQSFSEVDYPGRGILRFDTWWCPLQIDHRFLVILHLPHDVHTREAVTELRRDPRPAPGEPCQLHGYLCRGHAQGTAARVPAGLFTGQRPLPEGATLSP